MRPRDMMSFRSASPRRGGLPVASRWALVLGLLWIGAACRIDADDVQEWQGTVKGPGKIVAVMLANKYDLDLRSAAALALVEMQRQDVNGVQELRQALQQLDPATRSELVTRLIPGLERLMTTPDPDATSNSGPSPLQARAKDTAFLLASQTEAEHQARLVELIVDWYVADFNGRSLAGNYSAEQVVRAHGAPAAARLVEAMNARLPQQALVKLAALIAELGDAEAKAAAAKRLVAIEQEMSGEGFVKWLAQEIRAQLKASKQDVDDARVTEMAQINRQLFVTEGAIAAMKHLADQDEVAARLLALADTAGDAAHLTERRTRALQALEGHAKQEHLDLLLKLALDDDNPTPVRDYAFDRVGDIRSPQAIPQMWGLVQNNTDARLRWRAGELVLAIGGPEVLGEFFRRLPAGASMGYLPEELEGYATRMGQMKPSPREVATAQLRSPRWWERVVALRFFERKGEQADLAALESLTRDRTPVSGTGWPAGHTVGKVAETAVAALRQRLKEGPAAAEEGSDS